MVRIFFDGLKINNQVIFYILCAVAAVVPEEKCHNAADMEFLEVEDKGIITLPPTIMEVENGGLEDDWLGSKGAIFHFHD